MKIFNAISSFLFGLAGILCATYPFWQSDTLPLEGESWEINRFSLIAGLYVLTWLIGAPLFLWFSRHKPQMNIKSLDSYKKMWPFIKPYWGRLLLAILITIPIGSMDAVIAWSLKPFMDVVLVEISGKCACFGEVLKMRDLCVAWRLEGRANAIFL